MRNALALGLALAAVTTGCGGGSPSPEAVVRAWSGALNAGNDERAASLFAPNARVIQGGAEVRLATRAEALSWNSALPCSGRIVSLERHGDVVSAVFLLGQRPDHRCDGPGQRAGAVFEVRRGKIVLWHQVPAPALVRPATTSPLV